MADGGRSDAGRSPLSDVAVHNTQRGVAEIADATDELALLASAVAGRALMITPSTGSYAWTEGSRIHLPQRDDAARARCEVVIQAALVAAGTLASTQRMTLLTSHSRKRFLTLEVQRAIEMLHHVIPGDIVSGVAEIYSGTPTDSAAQSARRARRRRLDIPQAPPWYGALPRHPLRASPPPAHVDGTALSAGQLAAARQQKSDISWQPTPLEPNRLTRLVQKMIKGGVSAGDPAAATGDIHNGVRAAQFRPSAAIDPPAQPPLERPGDEDRTPGAGWRYPEWDCHRRAYKPRWCRVAEHPLALTHTAVLSAEHDRGLVSVVAQIGRRRRRHRRQTDGDTIDVNAVIDHAIARRAGAQTEAQRLYEAVRRDDRDLGVLILLDATGSTNETDTSFSVFDAQRRLAARLADAFDTLGDRVAIYGFRSRGRSDVQFVPVKTFDEPLGALTRRRLHALQPVGFTRFGAAIRHATALLREGSGATRTLLVAIGDAFPYDDNYEHRYAEADSQRAVREAVDIGVGFAGIAMRASADLGVLQRVYGEAAHTVIDEPDHLNAVAGRLFNRALDQAMMARRRI